jgi:prepilin-type N-terminal cleavage/methylation domain-containing protein
MKVSGNIAGFTLFELVLAVTILAILVSMVAGVGGYALMQAKIRLAESTISILVTALEQYHDFTGTFPPECNNINCLEDILDGDFDGPGEHLPGFFSSEVLYYCLNRIPASSRIIGAISDSQTTNLDEIGRDLRFIPNPAKREEDFSLIRFIDPWGKSLRYEYQQGDNFPKITSAGPDKFFGNKDDIASKGI